MDPNALSTRTFFSDEKGFEVASVIVIGKMNAALLDAQHTLSNAHRVIAEIAETGKNLETIYITQAHPFTNEVTAEERRQWIRDIETLEKLGAEVIIPGHQKPGMPFDTSSFQFTKDYLVATEEELARTGDEGGFYFAMSQRFPNANLFISNTMNAGVFKGGRDWNWKD